MNRTFVYVLRLIAATALLSQVLSSGDIPTFGVDVLLNSSDFVTGHVVYDFGSGGTSNTYSLIYNNDCPNDTFSIGENTGEVFIIEPVEFPIEPVCVKTSLGCVNSIQNYKCFAVTESLSLSYGVLVVITVVLNLSSAQIGFQEEFYTAEVMEGVQSAALLSGGGIQAITLPVSNQLTPDYRILNGHGSFELSEHMILCSKFVQIYTTQALDRETQDYYEITVEAYTSHSSANATIRVYVLDRNDNGPSFLSSSNSITVSDSSLRIGEIVTQFEATDADSGLNTKLLYSLTSHSSLFTINPFTGSLFRYSSHSLEETTRTVRVSDSGTPQQEILTNITLFIVSEYQQRPRIHDLGQLLASESDLINRVVSTILITYTTSSNIVVNIDSLHCNCFKLANLMETSPGSYSVELQVNTDLDFESFPDGINITITATDEENPEHTASRECTVDISDVNEPPEFLAAEYEVAVLEGTPVGSEIFRMRAIDQDSGPNGEVVYTFTSVPQTIPFSLNSSTGILYSVSEIDHETTASASLMITAEDGAGEQDHTTLQITVLDRNDQRPSFTNSDLTVEISETILANESFFYFTSSDGDSECNGAVTYSIIHADPPVFRIDSVSGLLYPLDDDSIDYEQFHDARVVVRATDLGEDSRMFTDTTLHIDIVGANDEHPQMSKIECPCFLTEATTTAQQCHLLSAYDADSTGLSFSIRSGNEEGLFIIDSETGLISTNSMFTYSDGLVYTLDIVASDGEFESEPETLRIVIVDSNNDIPAYADSIVISQPADTPVGSLVGNVSVQHGDVGYNALTEYLIVQSDVTDLIRLDSLSGNLYLNSAPQIDTAYAFTVKATDLSNSAHTAATTVTITFSGERNNPPYFQASIDRIEVASNSLTESTIYTISAVDDDAGDNDDLTYTLARASDVFQLSDDGELSLSQSLSNRVGTEFTLSVSVCDSGSPQLCDNLELMVTVYGSTVTIGGIDYEHHPGESVHYDFALIPEGTSASLPLLVLPAMEDGHPIQYAILEQGEFYDAFQLDGLQVVSQSGNQDMFDRERNEAIFIVLRAQYGENFFHHSLTIGFEDINDNGPEFDQDEYSVEIYRNTPRGGYIFELDAADPDTDSNANTTYSISPNAIPFEIVPNTGFVEVIDDLVEDSYTITVIASDAELSDLPSAMATLTITILETTNNAPNILPDTVSVLESASVGTVVHTLTINDEDSGTYGSNTICLASGVAENHFSVNQRGEIIIAAELDYEKRQSYTLTVMAYDSSPNPKYSTSQIRIDIEDGNDIPIFSSRKYFATIVENNPAVTPVLIVIAFDMDFGEQANVRYSMNGTTMFSVDPMTGVVSTASTLNRESMTQHSFTVSATDSGDMYSTAGVLVSVLDENDNDPNFISPNFVPVKENTPLGTQLIQLEAVDNDYEGNGSVKFEIVSGNDANILSLDPFSGSVTLSKLLDFETDPPNMEVVFRVSDLGTPPRTSSTTHQIIFSLEDVNDNYPIFSSSIYTCTINEGDNGDFMPSCQVSATDTDESDSISYDIISGNTGQAFEIDSESGILVRQAAINRESISQYVLKIKATDSGSPPLSSYTVVIIEVGDENDDTPKFDPTIATHISESNSRLSQLYFSELLPPNTLLFFAHAVDRDIGENGYISYSITSENTDLFQIDVNMSAVILTGGLDYETAQSHELTIQASNPSGTATSHTYTIKVLNENENLFAPVFSPDSPGAVTMKKNAPIGAHVVDVSATDVDPGLGGVVRYYITGGSGYGYFTIDQFHGEISVMFTLTGTGSTEVTLEITATDLGDPSLSSVYTLIVFLEPDSRSKPYFSSAQFTPFVPETFSSQIFASYQALVNGRPNSDVTYTIVSGNEGGKFSINSSTGAISTATIVDREGEAMYTLLVSASRGSTDNTTYALVAITVADVNDHTPFFQQDHDVTVFNNQPTGLNNIFMRVFAIDEDAGENSQLEYSITSDASNIFAIDSSNGDMYLTESLLTDGSESYEVSVSVTDMGSLSFTGSTTFTVSVASPAGANNNNAPSFASSSTVTQIPEDAAPGLLVYTAQASDSSLLFYRITEPLPNFAIMPNSGEVYLIKSLDREEEAQYTIKIEASDGTLSSSTFLLNILVTDVNDNRPVFTTEEFVFTAEEHEANGTVIGDLTATDMDDGNEITYSLVDSKYPSSISLFSLTTDGELQVAGVIDRETQAVHYLTVAAEDNGSPPLSSYARVKVTVTDVNDHTPVFVNPLPNVSVSENVTMGAVVFNISVFDPDTDNTFTYSLTPNTAPFEINESTGELYVTRELDAEKETRYSLVLSVADQDTLSMTASTTLEVTIVDELDSFPLLTDPGTVSILENMPPYTIVASLSNSGNLRSVHYEIISGNDKHDFFIESLTGIVRTAVSLDREVTVSYSLTVQGTFEEGYESTVTFAVLVTDVNDDAPSFAGHFFKYTLLENSSLSTPLVTLDFADRDEGTNKQIGEFYIPDPKAAKMFKVDSSGGLSLIESLDREGKFCMIDFELYLFDGGTPALYDLARLSITVSDVNDNPPYFLQFSYNFVVSLPVLVDTTLFSVQASDLDIDSSIRYTIIDGNGTDKFAINAITGGISITDNYKLQPRYSLTISARDESGREESVPVLITTKECGFNNLLFDPRDISLSLAEDASNNTVIFQPNLLTFNMPASVQYSFSTGDSLFKINNNTGVVSLQRGLDREQQATHQISVQARDMSDSSRIAQADIEIKVTDVNDNAPVFLSAPYEIYITDDYVGDIIRVRATDRDEGTNGEVSFHLVSGCSGYFEVEENAGQITLMSSGLDVDACGTLTIGASDKGDPQMSAETTVTVNVVDSNAPLFSQSGVYNAEVNESAIRDTVVITVRAEATSSDPEIRYNIDPSQSISLPFSIDFISGDVTVNGIGLDYETNTSYRLQLQAIDLSTSSEGRATLDIQVLDVNDNRPEFSKALYQSSVIENSNVGFIVGEVNARDLDSGLNSDITYLIDPNDIATTFFNIHEDTGLITTSGGIDREQNNFFRFSVLAKDAGGPSLTGTTIVQIEVIDVNDNTPTFLQSSYHGTVAEDDQVGTSILLVTATDPDDGDDEDIDYDIVTTAGSSHFSISSGGLITLATAATELSEFQYQLTISASDGELYGYVNVVIEIEDENSHPPVFNDTTYNAYIIENATIGTVVTQVFATDDDRGSNAELTYSISSDLFAINPETGVISVLAGLDRESYPNGVTLIVIARDGGGRTGTSEVEIELGDVNDNRPSFSSLVYMFDVLETANIGTTVTTNVMATDPDDGSNGSVRYSLSDIDNEDQFPFDIDENSGIIRTRFGLDTDIEDEYSFTVNAEDQGTPVMSAQPSASVTIQVIPDGEVPPRFENSSYFVDILENNQYGQVLLTPQLVVTSQTVVCDVLTFSLTNDNGLFAVQHEDNSLNATIIVTTILDREEMPTDSFTIQADCLPETSFELLSSFAIVFVNVLDQNERPSFSLSFLRGRIAEGIALETALQFDNNINNVQATDEDSGQNGNIRYSIDEDVPFEVDPISGIISVNGQLDRETVDEYRFNVIASDLGNPPLTDSIRIVVIIEDINDSPPVFDEDVYYGNVTENALINTVVFTLMASDADLGVFGVSTYSVSGSSVFNISRTSGELMVAGNIDRETESMYSLQVFATDGVQQVSTAVMITVIDVNDNPPIFNATQYEIEIPENYATGVSILQVFATDRDIGENAEVRYGILENQQLIHINSSTGQVSFSQNPDYEMSLQGHFEFRVTAMNSNDENLRAFVTLIIDLVDLNDNAPAFSEQSGPIQVSENRPNGSTVVRAVAEDLDSGVNARIQYTLSDESQEYFTIDSQTGIIDTRVSFDREINSSFILSVTATDLGEPPLSSNTTLTVSISDENDNPPVFAQENYTVSVLEGVPVGRVLESIRADDADEGINAELMYRLTGDNSAHFLLVSENDGGFGLQVAQMLNRENIDEYDLTITAFDGGFPFLQATASLRIVVLDENDNPPEFESPVYSVTVSEDLTVGSEVISVRARDPDSAETTQLTYHIFNGDPQFDIDVVNGSILLIQPLDYEDEVSHIIVVQAEDQVNAPATASVIVTVTNINDNAPEFTTPNFNTSVIENQPGRVLIDFTVFDRDRVVDPDRISFRIEAGNVDDIFSIDTTSGSLTVIDNFDFESLTTSEYLLTVTANDNDDPPLTGTAYVRVEAKDINDNAPEGEDQVIHVLLYNGQLVLTSLGELLIRDPDTVNDYQFDVAGDKSVFSIGTDGEIDIVQHPPPPGVYRFTIHVTDGDVGSATTQVNITVVNITDAHLANSFTMKVCEDSLESFLDSHLQPFLGIIEELVTDKVSISSSKAYVFYITDSGKREVDISIVVESGDGTLIHPTLVQHLMHINRDDIERRLGLIVLTEHVDYCADESSCSFGTGCVIDYQYSSSDVVLGSAAASIVGIEKENLPTCSSQSPECSIPCPEPSYCVQSNGQTVCIDDCSSNPCKNDGMCIEQMPGYYCSCPSGFDGRNCELTKSYFQTGSYAILPAVITPTNGTIALEFTASDGQNGLLYYSGRFDDIQSDFLALEIIDRHLSMLVSYGGQSMRESIRLAEDGLYTAVVEYSSTVSALQMVNLCGTCINIYVTISTTKFCRILHSL